MENQTIDLKKAVEFFNNDEQLRDYQKEACIEFCKTFNNQIAIASGIPRDHIANTLLVLATGGGKTLCAMKIVEHLCVNLKMRVLWMVHRRELVKQAAKTIRKISPHLKITYWDADQKDSSGQLVFAMMLSTRGRFECEELFDVVIVDEAHKVHGNNTYQITLGGNEDSQTHLLKYRFLLGLTATPIDPTERLAIHFTNICYQKTFLELVSEGWLAKANYIRFKTNIPMEEQIKYVGNGERDFTMDSLKELDNEKRNNLITDEYVKHRSTYGKTIMFAIDVNHGQELQRLLNEKDPTINAQLITGNTPDRERDQLLLEFKRGTIHVLVNIEVFIEGFDEPTIQSVFLCRPTLSKRIYSQSIGRACRIIPGQKDSFNIVDFVDLSDYYAYACEEWSVKIYGAKEDESLNGRRQQLQHEDRMVRIVERMVDAGFNPQIRRRIEKEMLQIAGIIKVGNNEGDTRRFLITKKQHAILGELFDSVQYWSNEAEGRTMDMDRFIPATFQKYCKSEGVAPFNVSQWRSICWGLYRRYVRGYESVYGHPETPSFEYTDLTPFIDEVKASAPEVSLTQSRRKRRATQKSSG